MTSDDCDVDAPEVYSPSRDGVPTVCRGCANVDAGPVPTPGEQPQQQQQQGQQPVHDEAVTCWRSDEGTPTCRLTPQRRPRTSPPTSDDHQVNVLPWQTST